MSISGGVPQEPQPWPRAQRMPLAIAGQHVQPWHHQAIAAYDEATRNTTLPHSNLPGMFTAAQVNQAIEWWNERVEAEHSQDDRNGEDGSALARILATLERHAARGSSGGEYNDADIRSILDGRMIWKTAAESAGVEQDGDVRAVAAVAAATAAMWPVPVAEKERRQQLWSEALDRIDELHTRFADRIAALEARDAKGGGE